MGQTLLQALENFQGANGNEENLKDQFNAIAKAAFYSGHFIINGKEDIYITDIEFYYHEENGNIKDTCKYHIGEESEIPYFPLGSLYPHQSGVDVTFENKDKKYRASFLIRGYQVKKDDEILFENNRKSKSDKRHHPRFLWDDLFGAANMIKGGFPPIEWVDEPIKDFSKKDYTTGIRVNIKDSEESRREWRYYRVFYNHGA